MLLVLWVGQQGTRSIGEDRGVDYAFHGARRINLENATICIELWPACIKIGRKHEMLLDRR